MLRDELGREWPESFASNDNIVANSERVPLRWLILALLALLRGVTLNEGGGAEAAWLWYAFGLAAIIAFVGDWTMKIGRNRQRERQKQQHKLDDPVPLMKVLRDYGVEELGGLYFYMPVPPRAEDQEARAWLRVLRAKRMVISGPWRLEASRAPPWLKKTHPRISSEDVAFYEIYRVNKDPLAAFV